MKQKILDEIKKYETIIIHRHVRPDPDAYGSQGGLAEILKASFPEKSIFTVGKEEETLHYMRRLDEVSDDAYNGALVIVCDTANAERICDDRYGTGNKLIKIDHHPNMDPYGDMMWVDTDASSTSEMIYEFYLFGKDQGLKMSDEAARLLFAGIVGDTGRFLYPSTTEKTFAYAGELIHYNFSRPELFDKMYELDANIVKLKGYVLQNFEMRGSGAAVMILKKELLEEFQAVPSKASLLVSVLGDVKGIKAWVFFIEESDQIRVRFRSKGPIINEVARKYNGGGHPLAAGASIYSWEEMESVVRDLEDVCKAN
ncbi:bifunctional oligoribonuclease/PAP phosphatase NrnA [Cytobacillus pseudoceanisediminis]|jgi:bifunctional oligoribonuclease and PAP phosphatase NrnA|uniref:Oligoribonuclease n=3 Tax=Cytobacillus TaxID=2675230 RepID=A0A160MF24_9BACI|nr:MULTISPECIES: bifunctional oligoribonuclease/PAP phosphatase NrnA [Cytobacillus]MBY0155240.1 bifunctional oligoribonuclease/PAP phosphatase NrnA [Cytobacillus firmus]AND41767.1 oligoribonuclease [Cytobacillus oceanisediminis 2691]MCM3392987.1 bifunctional oligoribonuclease/PAP phosphatase NrnA [Cytobacillus oceanisediminis]MCM3529997.1 bifunctional oligoribonuclease/PAP phosphatase NrnA [Cytobacillus oceanisediminis]OHX50077.1 oligoribonuclease [Cytobacillus oceanisediminis]